MKTIFLLFDSLNLRALSCYGGTTTTPHFDRLKKESVSFSNHFSGSLPCMPARRDLLTGRYNFFHSAWGPLEPYDNVLTDIMRDEKDVYSHIITDHIHYFEDGGAFYHTRYNTWEFFRGQEYDPWIPVVNPDLEALAEQYDPRHYNFTTDARGGHKLQHALNKQHALKSRGEFPLTQCFDSAIRFLDINGTEDDWFLQLECFDPHEPFDIPREYLERFELDESLDAGAVLNWPNYARVVESPDEVKRIRRNYQALVAFCDDQLGRLLDYMDEKKMWDDTALIVTTDHGYLLSEHDWWAKTIMPPYQEISHIPLMVRHPDYRSRAGESRRFTTSAIDIMPTILDWHGCGIPKEVRGRSLTALLDRDSDERRVVTSGIFGGCSLITDGRYSYYYFPEHLDSTGLNEYRIHPCHMRSQFSLDELRKMDICDGFDFTKGIPLLKIPGRDDSKRIPNHDAQGFQDNGTRLFDLRSCPDESEPCELIPEVVRYLEKEYASIMRNHDAPEEMFDRFRLSGRTAACL